MPSYTEGRQARRDGLDKTANPYQPNTPAHRNWNEGWQDSDTIMRALGN